MVISTYAKVFDATLDKAAQTVTYRPRQALTVTWGEFRHFLRFQRAAFFGGS